VTIVAALLFGMLIGSFVPVRRWYRTDRRLGSLPSSPPVTDREERLRQLGDRGTYRVYNCGKILYVDYERGELIVEREGRMHA
jgi:hypothetical protein